MRFALFSLVLVCFLGFLHAKTPVLDSASVCSVHGNTMVKGMLHLSVDLSGDARHSVPVEVPVSICLKGDVILFDFNNAFVPRANGPETDRMKIEIDRMSEEN